MSGLGAEHVRSEPLNLAKGSDMAEKLDMSVLGAGHVWGIPLEPDYLVG
jgi:hypothetical protein